MRVPCMVLIGILCVVAGTASQDVVFLKDGQKFKGKIVSGTLRRAGWAHDEPAVPPGPSRGP